MKTGIARRIAGTANLPSGDLGLELLRQHDLLTMMTGRMNELASALDRGVPLDPERIERALEVHRRFLIEAHYGYEAPVLDALKKSRRRGARALAEAGDAARTRAEAFQRAARALLQGGPTPRPSKARELAALLTVEGDEIETQDAREDELYRDFDGAFSSEVRGELVRKTRGLDATRIAAEMLLTSWVSQLHGSSD